MKIKLTTNLIKQNQFGTCHGYGDPDNLSGADEERSFDSYIYWNNEKYMHDWSKCVYNWLEIQLKDISRLINYNIKTEHIGYQSPTYYNYSTDEMYFDLVGNWSLFKKAVLKYLREEDLIEEFNNYLVDNYSSYSGFISFGTNNYEDWLDKFNEQSEIEVGAIIAFLIDAMLDEQNYESVFEDLYYDNYINWEEVKKIREYRL